MQSLQIAVVRFLTWIKNRYSDFVFPALQPLGPSSLAAAAAAKTSMITVDTGAMQ